VVIKKLFLYLFVLFTLVFFVSGNLNPSVTLSRPGDSEVVGNPVTFEWRYFDAEGDPLEYSILQIDDDRKFFSPDNHRVYGTEFKIEMTESGEYFWRVQVVNSFGEALSLSSNRIFVSEDERICSDGTIFFECSNNKPGYCDSGVLEENCQKCGCSEGGVCQPDGSCLLRRCADGTVFGRCSSNQPVYCFNGVLREVCSLCGCPNGLECAVSGKCAVLEHEEVIVQPAVSYPEPEEYSFFERIVGFFRYIFTGESL